MIATQSLSSSVLLPLLCPTPPVHSRVARSQLSDFEFVSKLPSITFLSSHKFSKRTRTSTVRGINSNDPKESAFFDENGVVEDMDSYLNYLSLEYDSVWDTKPSWCQPWTITLTGTVIISLSWLILHSAVATAVVMTTIAAWWYIFLYSYPKLQHVMTNEVSLNKVAVDQSYTIRETSKWLPLNFGTVRSLILSGESGDVIWFSIAVDAFGIFRHDCIEKKECDKRFRKYTSNVRWTPLGQQYSVRWSRAYSNMIEERRKRVTKGLEDTYGERKSQ